ncbi:inositol monophosphatase family protein [Oceanobacillus sp. CAU 1775]
MDNLVREEIYTNAKQWILEAGQRIKDKMYEPHTITTKSNPNDLVTEIDKDTEIYFISKIKEAYPNHLIIGEEGFGDDVEKLEGIVWIIDPIDGTMNFVHQKKNFAISIGVYVDGVGEIGLIYDVMADELYHAKRTEGAFKNDIRLPKLQMDKDLNETIIALNHHFLCENRIVDEREMQKLVKTVRGTRTYGSAALEFAYVAEGILDGYFSMRLAPWDIAAGMVLVNEVGGVTTNLYGEKPEMLKVNTILTCNTMLQGQLLKFIEEGRK